MHESLSEKGCMLEETIEPVTEVSEDVKPWRVELDHENRKTKTSRRSACRCR